MKKILLESIPILILLLMISLGRLLWLNINSL